MRFKLCFLVTLVIGSAAATAQRALFDYRRCVGPVVVEDWYRLKLSPDIPGRMNANLTDLRLYHFTQSDSSEVPYVLKLRESIREHGEVPVEMLNNSKKDGALFATFKLPKGHRTNKLKLQFSERNFDGFASLEGSHDQQEWFILVDRRRIIDIHDAEVDFSTTTLNFRPSDFRYLRVRVAANTSLTLESGSVQKTKLIAGSYHDIPLSWSSTYDKKNKKTVVIVNISTKQLVTGINVGLEQEGDYYRPFSLEVLKDSTKTSAGWQYYYDAIAEGYLTSTDSNGFVFPYVKAGHLRLTIKEHDNPPLQVVGIMAQGPDAFLYAKISPGTNCIEYGNEKTAAPNYDLKYFEGSIPEDVKDLAVGDEEKISTAPPIHEPLFSKKLWLWIVMGATILVLAFFTRRLMAAKVKEPAVKD
jgi:hypothetical protein